MPSNIKIAAVGDISFAGRHADKPSESIFSDILPVFKNADCIIANLEGPLFDGDNAIRGKCTIRGATGWGRAMADAGINMVSLANNHIMDHGENGLFSTIESLDRIGIRYAGAGPDRKTACEPVIFSIRGVRLAFLARTMVEVSSRSYAGDYTPGSAFFDLDETLERIRECSRDVDLTILSMHWGLEHYHYPTLQQRHLSLKLNEAGADIIIGHHPHVLQGIEKLPNGLVAYSLGNFFFDEFSWPKDKDTENTGFSTLALSKENRNGVILEVEFEKSPYSFEPFFSFIRKDGFIRTDTTKKRQKNFRNLSLIFRLPFYGIFWKLYSLLKEFQLRVFNRFPVSGVLRNIFHLRPRHLKELFVILKRSTKIVSGKSTNPYE